MLLELRVENLLLIERAELRLGPGLNVLTGETGAGKTMLAHALDLLLGGRARSGIVRPGAEEAYVEGIFALDERVRELLGERLPAGAEELVLARRVWPDGRTRAYLDGRARDGRRPARGRRRAARLLRPARAPPPDARLRAAGDPRSPGASCVPRAAAVEARASPRHRRPAIRAATTPIVLDVRGALMRASEEGRTVEAIAVDLQDIDTLDLARFHGRRVVIFCGCPNEASAATAALKLQSRGVRDVHVLRGGVDALSSL